MCHWYHLVTGVETVTMSGISSCTGTCVLILYACFSTALWIGLAAILGHKSHTAVTCPAPTIKDNKGSVKVISEETYNIDLFNSHTATKSEIK